MERSQPPLLVRAQREPPPERSGRRKGERRGGGGEGRLRRPQRARESRTAGTGPGAGWLGSGVLSDDEHRRTRVPWSHLQSLQPAARTQTSKGQWNHPTKCDMSKPGLMPYPGDHQGSRAQYPPGFFSPLTLGLHRSQEAVPTSQPYPCLLMSFQSFQPVPATTLYSWSSRSCGHSSSGCTQTAKAGMDKNRRWFPRQLCFLPPEPPGPRLQSATVHSSAWYTVRKNGSKACHPLYSPRLMLICPT